VGTSITSGGILTVAADETAATLTVRATSDFDDTKSGTAMVTVTLDPENNATINGQEIGLAGDAGGEGWRWNATDKTLTLTGGVDLGDVALVTGYDINIVLDGDSITAGSITITGGGITITSPNGDTLTLNSLSGPALSASGDIVIEGGTVYAVTFDVNVSAIESTGGSVIITGTASVTAVTGSGSGSAISAAVSITISTDGKVKVTTDAGYCLEGATITITNGKVELFFNTGGGAFSATPDISGDKTTVKVNGQLFYGSTGDGCNTGMGMAGALMLAALLWEIRRRMV